MEYLREKLDALFDTLSAEHKEIIKTRLSDRVSVYPFNEYEYRIAVLIGSGKMCLDDYHGIRDEYIARNLYLYIFEISSPRGFGEQWAQGHLKELVPDLAKPTRKIAPHYKGKYDFMLTSENDLIRIEVKVSRSVRGDSPEPLYMKALSYEIRYPFWMNFQQIKPAHCDVFVWGAVWRDVMKYWVLSSNELRSAIIKAYERQKKK